MDETMAREIIDKMRTRYNSPYCDMDCGLMSMDVCMDGYFTVDELEAVAWWMRNKH